MKTYECKITLGIMLSELKTIRDECEDPETKILMDISIESLQAAVARTETCLAGERIEALSDYRNLVS